MGVVSLFFSRKFGGISIRGALLHEFLKLRIGLSHHLLDWDLLGFVLLVQRLLEGSELLKHI